MINLDERLMRKGIYEIDMEILFQARIESNECLLKNNFEMEKSHYHSALIDITSIQMTLWVILILIALGNQNYLVKQRTK